MMTQLTIKCVICTGSGILLAFVHAREVGVSSRNLASRTFPQYSQSMLTPMLTKHNFFSGDHNIYDTFLELYAVCIAPLFGFA